MSIPVNEQETTVSFCRSDNYAVIYTSDSTVMTKLDKKDIPQVKERMASAK